MSALTRFASTAFAISATVTLIAAAAGPAMAEDKPSAKTVEMPADWLAKPSTKFCLSRNLAEKSKRASVPRDGCQTRDEWAAVGVNIVAKK
jgi:hypothetical protein